MSYNKTIKLVFSNKFHKNDIVIRGTTENKYLVIKTEPLHRPPLTRGQYYKTWVKRWPLKPNFFQRILIYLKILFWIVYKSQAEEASGSHPPPSFRYHRARLRLAKLKLRKLKKQLHPW